MTRWLLLLLCMGCLCGKAQVRKDVLLNKGWETSLNGEAHWRVVEVPHNWDDYGGYRRLRHGNLHGYAFYRRHLKLGKLEGGKRYFLFFEGVSSYATVWVNGAMAGRHAGGRTSFTLDVTGMLHSGDNLIRVRADHPAGIRDLPWVCGGCSDERGFSEGSQPLGIFRPVHLVVTGESRIEPFGVHIWNDTTANETRAKLYMETEVKNYGGAPAEAIIVQRLAGQTVRASVTIQPGETKTVRQELELRRPRLWSNVDAYLYILETEVESGGQVIDAVKTSYGIRVVKWEGEGEGEGGRFLLNGEPVFINGIAGYEHKIGGSHAFSPEEIRARVMEIRAAGFNAFRDAHQPHNLLYQRYWDSLGMLWWPQLSAHIWYDSPEFRQNFKTLLTDWVKERRNSPSIVLWGLQNESRLPEDFARECTELIRKLDPTASVQRKVTTCNGGSGTDWDVPQNWTGTYGGDPARYAEDLVKQVLVGEYGGWRTMDLHRELPRDGQYGKEDAFSEDRLCQLMETKIRLAETVRNKAAGQFFWLFSSHDNPGRVQSGEGWRELDRIGPVNYKGLFSSWGEPADVYYLYRANFVSKEREPMVYIVSHTWPDRWTRPGVKGGIKVYSNCDEVELFNDVDGSSLGRRKNGGKGTHFQWDSVDIRYNVLYALGYVGGKIVARDCVVLHHLPVSPHFGRLVNDRGLLRPAEGYNYVYRINCGGPEYKDHFGNVWSSDEWSRSWTDAYPGLPRYFASQRRSFDPIAGVSDWPLFQDFRYGLGKLGYDVPLADGDYRVELYFTEPWYGRGGGLDCKGWRLFDIALNGRTVARDVDIWKEAGYSGALKKVFTVHVTDGRLRIDFPRVEAGQAVISAIAIAGKGGQDGVREQGGLIGGLVVKDPKDRNKWSVKSWMDTGVPQYSDEGGCFAALPPELYGADWVRGPHRRGEDLASFQLTDTADVWVLDGAGWVRKRWPRGAAVALDGRTVAVTPVTRLETAFDQKPMVSYKTARAWAAGDTVEWDIETGVADKYSLTLKYRWRGVSPLMGRLTISLENGTVIREEDLRFTTTPEGKWGYLTTSTGGMVNAGKYKIRLVAPSGDFKVDELQVQ
ncbi:MAG TPA: malectin domain-containing carbohydrate-binding protein [Puia sp.]